jgi:glycerol kinase
MSGNNWIAQDLADILALPVERPADTETTALGAAMLAAVGAGVYASLNDAGAMCSDITRFGAAMATEIRAQRINFWRQSLRQLISA